MIALKVTPRICIVVCEAGWTIFTFAQASARSSRDMYAFRFMIGIFESGFSPIIIFLFGSWYTRSELAKRIAIWHITGFFGSATSGFLQAGIHKSLDGSLGLSGWRWMYIAWYITEADKEIAMRRSARQGTVHVTGRLDLALLKRMFGNWRWWTLCLMYIFYGNSCQANSYFAIYLREAGYSVTKRNIIPAMANLVSMVTDYGWGSFSDMTGSRSIWIVGPLLCTTVIGSSILTAWPPSDAAKVVAFFFVSGGYTTAVAWTWANEINRGNAEERALTISSMNGLFYATILTDFLHKRQLDREAKAAASLPASERLGLDIEQHDPSAPVEEAKI
ncbi:MFS transporter, ACS family, pantothenate transporter [Geosmithia morbida]|uniref:MFS transporter, ACS family, pantothenate transporter n=1 Tax=Geosmithia morbida TaxID=1094350 RepID=A0A9P4YRK4_9HYPO|nr:MFS transporter, ACS family, pantothenate transporter [Geosmithia morbida]KAF4121455.1 MFS transporter, ACS family, pantothenate transporter [Geosmithia morbida]